MDSKILKVKGLDTVVSSDSFSSIDGDLRTVPTTPKFDNYSHFPLHPPRWYLPHLSQLQTQGMLHGRFVYYIGTEQQVKYNMITSMKNTKDKG